MRVLALNDEPVAGGAAQLFQRTNQILRHAGHDIIEVTGDTLDQPAQHSGGVRTPNARVHQSRRFSGRWREPLRRLNQELRDNARQLFFPRLAAYLNRVLDRQPVDIAHVHNLHSRLSTCILPVLKRRRIPIVYQVNDYFFFCNAYSAYNRRLNQCCKRCIHGNVFWAIRYGCVNNLGAPRLEKAFLQALTRAALRLARPWQHVDLFLVTSDQAGALLTEWGIKAERQFKIFNAMALDEFAAHTELGHEVVFYGTCLPTKGVETFLSALEHVDPACQLGVYLLGMASECQARFRALADRRGLRLHVDPSLTWHAGLRERVAAARAVVVPSMWWVTSENVVYEALLSGKPVIVSRIGGNIELVEHGKTGLLVEPGNAKALAEAINLLSTDQDLARQMGQRAYQYAHEHFAESVFSNRLIEAYQRAIAIASN